MKRTDEHQSVPLLEKDDYYMTSYNGKRKREGGEEISSKEMGEKGIVLFQKWDRLVFVKKGRVLPTIPILQQERKVIKTSDTISIKCCGGFKSYI